MDAFSSPAEFTLVEACVLPVSGNVFQNAMVFGDADNDERHDAELVIGTLNGELLVYKGRKLLCCATDLGSVCTLQPPQSHPLHTARQSTK